MRSVFVLAGVAMLGLAACAEDAPQAGPYADRAGTYYQYGGTGLIRYEVVIDEMGNATGTEWNAGVRDPLSSDNTKSVYLEPAGNVSRSRLTHRMSAGMWVMIPYERVFVSSPVSWTATRLVDGFENIGTPGISGPWRKLYMEYSNGMVVDAGTNTISFSDATHAKEVSWSGWMGWWTNHYVVAPAGGGEYNFIQYQAMYIGQPTTNFEATNTYVLDGTLLYYKWDVYIKQ